MTTACFAGEFIIYPSDTPVSPTLSHSLPSLCRTEHRLTSPVLYLNSDDNTVTCILQAGDTCCHELEVLEVLPAEDHWNTGIYLDGNNWEAHFIPVRIFQLQSIHTLSQMVEVSRARQVPQQALLTMLKCNKQRAVALHEGVHINPCLESVWLADSVLLGCFSWKMLHISLVLTCLLFLACCGGRTVQDCWHLLETSPQNVSGT